MDSGRQQHTFFWFIENYSYQSRETQDSPRFSACGLGGTSWYLQLNPKGYRDVCLFLCRNPDAGPENVSVRYELSILGSDGSPLSSVQYDQTFYKYNRFGQGETKSFKIDKVVLRRNSNYLPRDTLTVRCKISKSKGNVVHSIGQCSARTRIKVEKVSFLHKVEQFSTLAPLLRHTIHVPSHFRKDFISSLYTTMSSVEDIILEIIPSGPNRILQTCELYLLDAAGNTRECGGADFRYNTGVEEMHTLTLSVTKKEVLSRKDEYLPRDEFSLMCRCTFSNGLDYEAIEETIHEMPMAVNQKLVVPIENDCKSAEKISTYPGALDDMKALYLSQSLTDVQLKTNTKSFPAHKAVLCARSPVFNAMMNCNMKEKNTSCIDVDDLEDDVVQQLLLFLYSDSVEDLEWKMATRLYYAADKYEVGKLKEVCSSFLFDNLAPTNAGELLLLADTHGDADLKKSVEDFILKNEKEVFGSEEWEELMETNPVLVMKTMHLKYKRRKME